MNSANPEPKAPARSSAASLNEAEIEAKLCWAVETARTNATSDKAKRMDLDRVAARAKADEVARRELARYEAAQEQRQQEQRQELVKSLKKKSGVFAEFALADLDDLSFAQRHLSAAWPKYRAARDQMANLLDTPGELFLRGETGCGKTHLASALVNRFCERLQAARFVTAAEFFCELQSTFDAKGHTKMDFRRRYQQYPLLVIDEFEVRSNSKWENMILRDIINTRHGNLRATIFATNLQYENLEDRLPGPVRSRIDQRGGVVDFEWADLRPFVEQAQRDRLT
jgi:DNA replication protein DnaC